MENLTPRQRANKRWYQKNIERERERQRKYQAKKRQRIKEDLERLDKLEKVIEEHGIVI